MNSENKSLMRRFAAPKGCSPLSTGVALSLTAVSSILAGAFPSDYGGIIFLIMSVGLFSYVLTARFNLLFILASAVCSVAVSMACGVKLPYALVALSFIPLSFILSDSVRKRKCLSQTVSALTVGFVALIAAILGLFYLAEGNELVTALTNMMNDFFASLDAYIAKINEAAKAAGKEVYTENYIQSLKNAIYLLMPSMIVLVCMAASFAAAKVFRLATIVADSNEMFFGGAWPVSASFLGSIVFLVAFIVSIFTLKSQIVYYSAVNIMYIFMPSQTIVGFKLMFARGGFLRHPQKRGLGLITTGLLIYFAFVNPILILELAAMFTAFYNIRVWMYLKRKSKENKQD